jgi:hypothetical protein
VLPKEEKGKRFLKRKISAKKKKDVKIIQT